MLPLICARYSVKTLGLALVWAALLAASAAGAAEEPQARSIERFEVGQNVFVRSLAVSRRTGSLWVGTSVGALEIDLATRDAKKTFTRADGLANEYVFAIGESPEGDIWFGTNAGGTSRYRDGAWRTYFPMHGLADYWVYAFAFAADGTPWIGTWDGANSYDRATDSFTTYRDELINIWVYGIDIDTKGNIWFGTEGGVSMFDGARWQSWSHKDGLGAANSGGLAPSSNTGLGTRSRHDLSVFVADNETYNPDYVFAVKVDARDGGVWFGTWGGGVSVRQPDGQWRSFTTADGLAGNIVYSIAQDGDGAMWFGTNQGISRFDGTTWTTYRHGLPAPHVYAIVATDDGDIWAGVKGAVVRLTVPQ